MFLLASRPLVWHFPVVAAGSFAAALRRAPPAESGSRFPLPFSQISLLFGLSLRSWLVCVRVLIFGSLVRLFINDLFGRNDGIVNRKAARDLKLSWDFVIFV